MAKNHIITINYAGGAAAPAQATITAAGTAELNYSFSGSSTISASATTTLTPPVVMTPSTRIQSYSLLVSGGNATFAFTPITGSATTIGLTDGVPVINYADQVTDIISNVPTGAETYTLSIRNANTIGLSVDFRMLLQ